jgi:NADPH:quinone reductase
MERHLVRNNLACVGVDPRDGAVNLVRDPHATLSARGAIKLAVARSLGAEFVVDYGGDAWAKGVAAVAGDGGVQVVFDGVGGSIGREAFELLAPGGRLCRFGMASGTFRRSARRNSRSAT